MKRLQPIVWQKGALLTPQHLQGQDRFVESLLQFYVEALSFRPWGFAELQVDQEALAAGLLAITRASGMFPDGLPFDIPASDPAPAPKPLAPYFVEETRAITASLAVPHYRDHGLNLSVAGEKADTRYVAGVETVRDEMSQQSERPIQVARKNFRFLVEGETGQGSSALGMARISRSEAGVLQLDPLFVPPLLDIAASALFDFHRPPAGGDHLVPQQRAGGNAAPEEPEPGGLHLGRYRQLLAALHHQHPPAADPPHVREQARSSRRACSRACSRSPAR